MQKTIRSSVAFQGVGLHTGKTSRVVLRPASAEYGIWFRRVDITDRDNLVPARWDAVQSSRLCTQIGNAAGVSVATVEHLMAAIAGCGLHNLLIEIDGPEVPIMDGSALGFVDGILSRGFRTLDAPVRAIEVLDPVLVRNGDAEARLDPSPGLEIAFHIDFPEPAIGRQTKTMDLSNGAFVHELAASRTFCLKTEVEAMRQAGLALGGSLDNAVVFDSGTVLSPGGLRHADEPVRHKMLDALGDLALAGAPILGRYTGHKAGHAITNALLHALFARPEAYRMVVCSEEISTGLPGAGVRRADVPACA